MELMDINDLKPGNKKKGKNRRSKKKRVDNKRSENRWSENKPSRRGYSLNSKPIVSLLLGLGFLSVILLATMFTAGATTKNTGSAAKVASGDAQAETLKSDGPTPDEVLGIVTAINIADKKIELYDIEKKAPATYTYSGGTNVTDKYGQPIATGQISIGTMVEASHRPNQARLEELAISTRAWEYVGVNNMSIDRSSRVMQIASTKYKYTDDIVILDGDKFIPVTSLVEQDELTVWGYEETIWAITVTRGHGTVRLANYESFLGDFITIGYEAMQQIAENMILTVREGNFNLTVENAKYTATKNITVYRNKETVVSLSDLGPEAAKVGRVTFEIKPFGADLFVDGALTSYANPIELDYGEHDLFVSLEGYTAYDGKLKVDAAGKTIRIELSEESSSEDASVSETDSGDRSDAGSSGTYGDSSDSNSSEGSSDTSSSEDSGDTDTSTDTQTEDSEPDLAENISNEEFEEDEAHSIYIQNPAGASVYLNGEYMCKSPGSFKKLIGTHVLTFIKEGYETTSYTVEVYDDGKNTYFNMPDLVRKK